MAFYDFSPERISANRPIAAGMNRLSLCGLIELVGPLIGTPDEFLAEDAILRHIDTQKGRSPQSQAQAATERALLLEIDFSPIATK